MKPSVWKHLQSWAGLVVVSVALAAPTAPSAHDNSEGGWGSRWVGTWSAAMQAPLFGPATTFDNQTLRQVVHVTIGGSELRVRFSNTLGTVPFTIGAASVGLQSTGASVEPGSLHPLTFGGASSITMPPGAVAYSDPVYLRVQPQANLSVSLYVPSLSSGSTYLSLAHQTSYVSPAGNFTADTDIAGATTDTSWYWLSGVEVRAPWGGRSIVAFGDSITEGFASTTDANSRWPDYLARRLLAHRDTKDISVLNEAISGNRVLNDEIGPNAEKRVDRDVLTQGGLAYVIVLLGTNDMGFSQIAPGVFPPNILLTNVSANDLIAGYKQIIRRAHEQGARVYGATILPFEGASYWDAGAEAKRETINEWIRTSGWYDAVIDFEKVVRDPSAPTKLLPAYDSGDHLHPNDSGYAAMGNSIDLRLF